MPVHDRSSRSHDGNPHATRRAGRERSDNLKSMIDAYIAAAGIKSATAARYRYELHRNFITPQMVRLK